MQSISQRKKQSRFNPMVLNSQGITSPLMNNKGLNNQMASNLWSMSATNMMRGFNQGSMSGAYKALLNNPQALNAYIKMQNFNRQLNAQEGRDENNKVNAQLRANKQMMDEANTNFDNNLEALYKTAQMESIALKDKLAILDSQREDVKMARQEERDQFEMGLKLAETKMAIATMQFEMKVSAEKISESNITKLLAMKKEDRETQAQSFDQLFKVIKLVTEAPIIQKDLMNLEKTYAAKLTVAQAKDKQINDAWDIGLTSMKENPNLDAGLKKFQSDLNKKGLSGPMIQECVYRYNETAKFNKNGRFNGDAFLNTVKSNTLKMDFIEHLQKKSGGKFISQEGLRDVDTVRGKLNSLSFKDFTDYLSERNNPRSLSAAKLKLTGDPNKDAIITQNNQKIDTLMRGFQPKTNAVLAEKEKQKTAIVNYSNSQQETLNAGAQILFSNVLKNPNMAKIIDKQGLNFNALGGDLAQTAIRTKQMAAPQPPGSYDVETGIVTSSVQKAQANGLPLSTNKDGTQILIHSESGKKMPLEEFMALGDNKAARWFKATLPEGESKLVKSAGTMTDSEGKVTHVPQYAGKGAQFSEPFTLEQMQQQGYDKETSNKSTGWESGEIPPPAQPGDNTKRDVPSAPASLKKSFSVEDMNKEGILKMYDSFLRKAKKEPLTEDEADSYFKFVALRRSDNKNWIISPTDYHQAFVNFNKKKKTFTSPTPEEMNKYFIGRELPGKLSRLGSTILGIPGKVMTAPITIPWRIGEKYVAPFLQNLYTELSPLIEGFTSVEEEERGTYPRFTNPMQGE